MELLHSHSSVSGEAVFDDDPGTRVRRLRELAAWYRAFAERAGNPAIWDARLRTAEDLDAEASRIDQPTSARSRTRTRGEDGVSDKPLTIDPVGYPVGGRPRDQGSGSAQNDFKLLVSLMRWLRIRFTKLLTAGHGFCRAAACGRIARSSNSTSWGRADAPLDG